MFKMVENVFLVKVYLRNFPRARIYQRAPLLLFMSCTTLFPAICQNGRHENLICTIYPFLIDIES